MQTTRFTLTALLAFTPLVMPLQGPLYGQKPLPLATPAAQTPAERSKALADLFHEMWEYNLEQNPEFASSIGDKRFNSKLSDYSAAAFDEQVAKGGEFLLRLGAIDTAGLPDQERLSAELMVRQLVEAQEGARFKPWEQPVDQFGGVQVALPQLVDVLSFTSTQDYEDYLARLHQVPRVLAQVTADCDAGIEDHRTPPKYLLEKVLVQTQTLAAQKPEDSPFAKPVAKFPAGVPADDQGRLKAAILEAVAKEVLPAYARFAKYLQSTYVPAGRAEPGVWSLPDGDAYYRFRVREQTTTDLSPEQIHQTGLDEVARDEHEMLAIAQKLGYKDIAALRAAIVSDPKFHPASREALLAAYGRDLDATRLKLPQYFGRLPKAQLKVEAVPAYLEKDQAPAYYQPGTPDGSRPGTIYINTYQWEKRALPNVEAIASHEGLPGHHLQISIAQELTGIPEFRKYGGYTAFVEGWGLYSERLAGVMGFYSDPYSEFGRLELDVWRAVRLVVDTGVHSQHWSREQMVDYFHAHSGLDEASVQAEVDRYVADPAQALAYKVGQLKLLELRAAAQQQLGSRFDERSFHDEILDSGAMPLDLLGTRVTQWIATQKGVK